MSSVEWPLTMSFNSKPEEVGMLKKFGLQAIVFLISVGFLVVNAQTPTVGTMSGIVRDSSGAAVPKAEVVIQQEGTGFSRTVNADENGNYLASSLPPGKDTVSKSPAGFKKTVVASVELHVHDNRGVKLQRQGGQETKP